MSKSRSSGSSLPAIDTLQKNVKKVPTYYARKPKEIPFHVPHKKLLEKIEYKKQEDEPLTGFKAAQEERYRRERKPSRVQLEPIHLEDSVGEQQTKARS